MTTKVQPLEVKTIKPLRDICPACGASLPILFQMLCDKDNQEDYSTALCIMASCKVCKQYITAYALGEERFHELLAKHGETDLREQRCLLLGKLQTDR